MMPWWATALVGVVSGIVGGVVGAWLREWLLHGQRRRWDRSVMRKEAPLNLENAAEYVYDTWDGKRGPTTAGEQAERDNAITTMDTEVNKYQPVLPRDKWKALRECVRDMRTGAHRGRPVDVRRAAQHALGIIQDLQVE